MISNAVGKADIPWWRTPRHARPEVDDPAVPLVVEELRRSIHVSGALGRALRHVVWALGWRARRELHRIQVSIRYVAAGAGVSTATAATACRRIADVLCASRDRGAWWTLAPESVAACWDLADEIAWAMDAPDVGSVADHVEPCGVVDLPPHVRGKASCPCGGHAHGDAHPSLVFDRVTGIGTCLTTGSVIVIGSMGEARIVRRGWSGLVTDSRVPTANVYDLTKYTQGPPVPAPRPSPTAPGRILTASRTARRRGPFVVTGLRRSARPRGEGDLAATLRGSDRAFGGPATQAKAEAAAVAVQAFGPQEAPLLLPDRFWSIDRWAVDWIEREGRHGRFTVPDVTTARNVGSATSLLDLDGLDAASTDPDPDVSARIRRAVRRASGGRLRVEAIVATSRTGLQVAVTWDRFWADTRSLYRDPGCLRTLEAAAAASLDVLGRGGKVDRASWAPGRYGRRPGWRVGRDGHAVRARLWWAR